MKIEVDNYRFDFPNAIDVYKFDEQASASPHYHGVTALKAVDVMVEMPGEYLFIEIKTFDDLTDFYKQNKNYNADDAKKWLIRNLSRKYRETFLYRYCERKLNKSISYICLLSFDKNLISHCRKALGRAIPVGKGNRLRWHRVLLETDRLFVVDQAAWNRNLTHWGTCAYVGH